MSRYNVVSLERFGAKRWRGPQDYKFAAKEAVVSIVGAEFRRAALAMPIAFMQSSGRYVPVAVLSLTSGHNMFVGAKGEWLGLYVPALLRGYPFRLLPNQDGSDRVFSVDENSGLISDDDPKA